MLEDGKAFYNHCRWDAFDITRDVAKHLRSTVNPCQLQLNQWMQMLLMLLERIDYYIR